MTSRRKDDRARIRLTDLFAQAAAGGVRRPVRTALTAFGTVIGVSALVVTLGLGLSASSAINRTLLALLSREVTVTAQGRTQATLLRSSTAARVSHLRGVTAVGAIWSAPPSTTLALSPFPDQANPSLGGTPPEVFGVSQGALNVIEPHVDAGRGFDAEQISYGDRVMLLGAAAAVQIGLPPTSLPRPVYIDGSRFLAEGIFSQTREETETLLSALVPAGSLRPLIRRPQGVLLLVGCRPGYARATAAVVPQLVSAFHPGEVAATTPPDPTNIGAAVSGNLRGLLVGLGIVSLLVGALGISTTTLLSVMERSSEIGLRRAIGARRAEIGAQFLLESLFVGALGGIFGDACGMTAVTAVAIGKGWTPSEPWWICIAAPFIGAVVGALAGIYPAIRAARLDPVLALGR
jgi:putative ABC transport system permease protein